MGEDAADPKAQLLAYLDQLAERSVATDYRGCGLSNAAVEYPEPDHPARLVGQRHKRDFRKRLREMAAKMGADDPAFLGDSLMLLIEGALGVVGMSLSTTVRERIQQVGFIVVILLMVFVLTNDVLKMFAREPGPGKPAATSK